MVEPSDRKLPELPFDGYRVQPVVKTTAPGGVERSYQAFINHVQAEAEVARFENRTVIDGAEDQTILWSVFGLRQGIAEHVADWACESEAFALLFALTGISGVSGQSDYPLPRRWIVLHEHRSGVETWVSSTAGLQYSNLTMTQITMKVFRGDISNPSR